MPNWCSTTIVFESKPEIIKDFHEKIKAYTSQMFIKTDFGKTWLGNILYGFNMENCIYNEDSDEYLRCRGCICSISDIEKIDENSATFTIWTTTAWSPMIKMWTEIIHKYYDDAIKVSWLAEEDENELYQTNDIDYFCEDRYWIEYCDEEGNWTLKYASTEENALKIINEFLEKHKCFKTMTEIKRNYCKTIKDNLWFFVRVLEEVTNDYAD